MVLQDAFAMVIASAGNEIVGIAAQQSSGRRQQPGRRRGAGHVARSHIVRSSL